MKNLWTVRGKVLAAIAVVLIVGAFGLAGCQKKAETAEEKFAKITAATRAAILYSGDHGVWHSSRISNGSVPLSKLVFRDDMKIYNREGMAVGHWLVSGKEFHAGIHWEGELEDSVEYRLIEIRATEIEWLLLCHDDGSTVVWTKVSLDD